MSDRIRVNVIKYIQRRRCAIAREKKTPVATQEEILEFLTAVMRRETTEDLVVQNKKKYTTEDEFGNKVNEEVVMPEHHKVPVKLSDAMAAAEKLNKYYAQLKDDDENEEYGIVYLPQIKENQEMML